MVKYSISLSGEEFKPSQNKFLSKQKVHSQHDVGDSRRDNKIFSYGHITINGDSISQLYDIVKEVTNASEININDIQFDIYHYYDEQCNLEFSLEELALIVELGANLNLSCSKA